MSNTVHCRLGAGHVSAGFAFQIPGQSPLYSLSLTPDKTEVDRELGRDLLDKVAGDIEGVEGNILHQEENGIWKLGQLTLTQVCKEDVKISGQETGDWLFVRSRCVLIPIKLIDIFSVLVPMFARMAVYTVHLYSTVYTHSTADTLLESWRKLTQDVLTHSLLPWCLKSQIPSSDKT